MENSQSSIAQMRVLLENIKINDVMETNPVKIYDDNDLSAAEEAFIHHKVFYLPVVNRDNKLVGFITHKYLYKAQSPRKIQSDAIDPNPNIIIDGDSFYNKETLSGFILKHVMNTKPHTLSPEDSLSDVINMFANNYIGAIPIILKDRELVGVIGLHDILKILAELLKEQS